MLLSSAELSFTQKTDTQFLKIVIIQKLQKSKINSEVSFDYVTCLKKFSTNTQNNLRF